MILLQSRERGELVGLPHANSARLMKGCRLDNESRCSDDSNEGRVHRRTPRHRL